MGKSLDRVSITREIIHSRHAPHDSMVKYLKYVSLIILLVLLLIEIYAYSRYRNIQSFIGLSYADCISILGDPCRGIGTDSDTGSLLLGYDFQNGYSLGFDRNMVCVSSFSDEFEFGIISRFLFSNDSDFEYFHGGKWHGFKMK